MQIRLHATNNSKLPHDAALSQWRLEVERARYEAERAERRYRTVEPENRLVARGLETEWASEDSLCRCDVQRRFAFENIPGIVKPFRIRRKLFAFARNPQLVEDLRSLTSGGRQEMASAHVVTTSSARSFSATYSSIRTART